MDKDKLCPHCGYYCTKKTVFCTPPIKDSRPSTEEEAEVINNYIKAKSKVIKSKPIDLPTRLQELAEEIQAISPLIEDKGYTLSLNYYIQDALRYIAAELKKEE